MVKVVTKEEVSCGSMRGFSRWDLNRPTRNRSEAHGHLKKGRLKFSVLLRNTMAVLLCLQNGGRSLQMCLTRYTITVQ